MIWVYIGTGWCVTGVMSAAAIGLYADQQQRARRLPSARKFRRALRHARAGDAVDCVRCSQPPSWNASQFMCACIYREWCGASVCLADAEEIS
jgi:hypothetical protein